MLSLVEKRGRPPKPGKRYPPDKSHPLGQPRPKAEPMSGALVQRMFQHGKFMAVDPRVTTMLGLLHLNRELTTTQTAAGYRIAEIYGRFERSQGMPRRSARSPSYDSAFRGASDRADDEEWALAAREAWRRLQIAMPHFEIGQALERLCVDNQVPDWKYLEGVRQGLDLVAFTFNITGAKGQSNSPPLHFNKHLRIDKQEPGDDEIAQARKDRERFRQDKAKGKTLTR